jgi:2-C-methyl-D-erythritol 4-phosphate cytidylyltransferase
MKKYAIIVAGGKGVRMGNEIPKQFLILQGKPVLMHSIERFYSYDTSIEIIVVLPSSQIDYWKELCYNHHFTIKHNIIAGGEQRFFSVRNGLDAITDINSVVAIHDGVRPLVSPETIDRCFEMACEKGNAIPAIGVVDSVRVQNTGGNEILDRNMLHLIQTPQTFQTKILKEAFLQPWHAGFTDDATVVEALGQTINLVEGNRQNIKVTTPIDLIIAEAIMVNGEL